MDHAGPCSYGCCPDGWCWCDGNRPDLAVIADAIRARQEDAAAELERIKDAKKVSSGLMARRIDY